jgi:predicted Rossmann fold flavoprotein
MDTKVCIIGAGPAGLTSAIFAAQAGVKVTIFEKNTTAGRKLLLTGGGRCNLTHTGTVDDFIRVYGPPRLAREPGEAGKQGRFLRHCLYEFSPEKTREFFDEIGIKTKVDENGCVFPVSERASDVRDVLLRRCRKLGVRFAYSRGIERVEKRESGFTVFSCGKETVFQKVIIATGGASYPQTGSTGDGYKLAEYLGHTITELGPALVPLVADEKWCADLAGVPLDGVKITARAGVEKFITAGAMIFTHDGIGGPAVLDLSRLLACYLPAQKPIETFIDIVPSMNESKLEKYLMEQFSQHSRKVIINILFDLVPKRLAGFICRRTRIAETVASQLKKEQRRQLIQILKKLPLSITAARPIEEAAITRGGVATKEIDPRTMQSKVCPGLFFAGEVIDADGPCGGYNLQICWSTGALAGKI